MLTLGLVCAKISSGAGYAIRRSRLRRRFGRFRRLVEVRGGWYGAYQPPKPPARSEEHTSELPSQSNLVCRLLLEKKKKKKTQQIYQQDDRNVHIYDICN